ncbi:hypothetical protein AUJ14_03340 [Candidatus Micrarchaeota archaeon CG1_02_55_22]|nr:MAG: hypothetical protein AUJ14_03340 [Candidatus Micrarchaeota archaeon CG1_02_55_22]
MLQILLNGIIAGAIYALVAAGFALVYSTARFVHFAHGAIVAGGAYALFFFFERLAIGFWPAAVLAIAVAALLGWVCNELVYKPLRHRGATPLILLLAGFALLVLIESLLLLIFGADVKVIRVLPVERGMDFFGAIITPLQVVIVVVAALLLVGLHAFMSFTRLGRSLRAVASNKVVAQIRGISVEATYAKAFLLASAIAGVAGILVGMEYNLEPTMGTSLVIKGFTGAIVGGVDSVPGAILGALLLGVAENVAAWYLPSGYKDAVAFVLLFLFLLFKPNGIMGSNKGARK